MGGVPKGHSLGALGFQQVERVWASVSYIWQIMFPSHATALQMPRLCLGFLEVLELRSEGPSRDSLGEAAFS